MHTNRRIISFEHLIAAIVILSTLSGCQTSRLSAFENVKPGMDKPLVLAEVGSPDISRRWNGKDRWIYNLTSRSEEPQTKEVHFENGRAVYVGGKIAPDVSAEQQDRLNAAAEIEAQKRESEMKLYRTEFVGIAAAPEGAPSGGPHVNQYLGKATLNDNDVEATARFNESMYGIPQSPQFEQRKIAPNFEEIDSSDKNSQENSGAR